MSQGDAEVGRLRVVAAFCGYLRDVDPDEHGLLLAPIRVHLENGVLACFCAPVWPCHAQVIAAFALAPAMVRS